MKISNLSLDDLNMDQLMELKDAVNAQIQSLAKSEMSALEEKIAKLKPLVGGRGGGKSGARGKAPAKFRDPKSGQTWSGRGMTPVWLRDLEAKGKSRKDYAV